MPSSNRVLSPFRGDAGNRFLTTLLWHLRQDRQFTEISLATLSAQDTARLATNITGCEVNANQAAHLYNETEGNPLFVVEIVRADLGREVSKEQTGASQAVSATPCCSQLCGFPT